MGPGPARQEQNGDLTVSKELNPKGDAMGATRRDKNRVTLVLRQVIEKAFNLPPGELPVGKHLPSLLIVPASQPCLLSDMSRGAEPSVWLRSHKIVLDGKEIDRQEGERVGLLMAPWRETRTVYPELFKGSVLVVGLSGPGQQGPVLAGMVGFLLLWLWRSGGEGG